MKVRTSVLISNSVKDDLLFIFFLFILNNILKERGQCMTINNYMNLSSISGTKIVSLANIQQSLMNNYRNIQSSIELLRLEHKKDYVRIYVKVPSETANIDYLVIMDFFTIDGTINGNTLFQCFSNSPALMFNFAYIYNQNDLLIPEFIKYFNKLAITNKPEKRNPSLLLGFEKSIFYTILFVQGRYKQGFPKDNKGTTPNIITPDKMVKLIAQSKEKFGVKKKTTLFKF
jgi:hypothetical protein